MVLIICYCLSTSNRILRLKDLIANKSHHRCTNQSRKDTATCDSRERRNQIEQNSYSCANSHTDTDCMNA